MRQEDKPPNFPFLLVSVITDYSPANLKMAFLLALGSELWVQQPCPDYMSLADGGFKGSGYTGGS